MSKADMRKQVDEMVKQGHSEYEAAAHLIRKGYDRDDAYDAATEAIGDR